MSVKNTLSMILAAAAFSASVFSLASAAEYRPPAEQAGALDATNAEVAEEAPFTPKIIRIWNGKAAVFEPGAEEPDVILPADADSLPEEFWERLVKGIIIHTREQYNSYMEDFS